MDSKPVELARSRGLGRVAVYYVILGVLLWLGVPSLPLLREAVSGLGLSDLGQAGVAQLLGTESPPPVGPVVGATPWAGALLAGVSMLGALAIMIPVVWIYLVTRRHRGYHESVVHTLLILPVAVTGIVMIVKESVPLAFSLAGIVAAVRFRTTLEDTKDAVYVFLAIGVGLASGVQALGIALMISLVFNAVVFVLWRTQFGNIYADRTARGGPLSLGDVVAGRAPVGSVLRAGDPAILEAANPKDLAEIAERAVRLERYISEERTKSKRRRANTFLMIHAHRAGPAQALVDGILDRMATRYRLVQVTPGPSGHLLEYLARLEGEEVQSSVMDALQEAPEGVVAAAELRSLKGLKPRT